MSDPIDDAIPFNQQGLQYVAMAQVIAQKATDDRITALEARVAALEALKP
jgi:hypothetical protein